MKKKIICYLLPLLCCLALLCGCGEGTDTQNFSYADKPFFLSVRGRMCLTQKIEKTDDESGGVSTGVTRTGEPLSFEGAVRVTPLPAGAAVDGMPREGGAWQVCLSYTAPSALAGLTLTCVYPVEVSMRTEDLSVTVSYPLGGETVTATLPYGAVAGLLRPALCLLPLKDQVEITAIEQGGRQVITADEKERITYHFSKDSAYPLKAESRTEEGWMTVFLTEAAAP